MGGRTRRKAKTLEDWLREVNESEIGEPRSFAMGLKSDAAAVQAAMIEDWSNGPVEGHVNRLKFVKRSMYGRAKFDLLRARTLLDFHHQLCGRTRKGKRDRRRIGKHRSKALASRRVANPVRLGGKDAHGGSLRTHQVARRDGLTIRQIVEQLGHSSKTVLKALQHAEPAPYTLSHRRESPVLGPFRATIDAILAADEQAPRKQRAHRRAALSAAAVRLRLPGKLRPGPPLPAGSTAGSPRDVHPARSSAGPSRRG